MSPFQPLSVHDPEKTPKGGVIVVQEAFGVNDHIEDVCRRFAAAGWLAVAPHLYHRMGDPKLGYDELAQALPLMQKLDADEILADIDTALRYLDTEGYPPEKVGVVGFCMGGTVALATGARRPVGAAVTFYGGGVAEGRFGFPPLIEEATRLQAPWLGLFGDLDEHIPVDDVEKLRQAAESAPVPTELVRYADAGHGFHCDARGSYHADSAKDAWKRTLGWFDKHIRKKG